MLRNLPKFITAFLLVFFSFSLSNLNADSDWDEDSDWDSASSINPFNSDYFHWSFGAGLLMLASDNGSHADPPAILPFAGGSFAWQFWGPLRLEITEDLYFTNYEFNAVSGYPMACNPENRSAFVMGFVTGFNLAGVFPLGEKGVLIRAYGGPVIDMRLVTLGIGLNHPSNFTGELETDARMQTNAIRKYFWSEGRMFLFNAGGGMNFPLNNKFLLGFDLRVWMPLYRLWTDDHIPAIDGWRFALGLRISPR
jgi:hypothetical protein